MAEHDATHGEHLGQIAQAQFVAQAPEHHEGDDIGRILGPVQQRAGALVELLATGTAAEPAIALGGALGALRHSSRSAFQAPHLRPPLCEKRPYTQPSPRRPGAMGRALTEPCSPASPGATGSVTSYLARLKLSAYLVDPVGGDRNAAIYPIWEM